MKFTAAALAFLAALPQTIAVEFTNSAFVVVAGQPIVLTWDEAVGAVSINLKNGDPNNLQTVETITAGQTANSYSWTPPASLPTDTYAFEIVDTTGTPNYSPQFQFAGTAATTSATTSTSSTTSTSTTSDSSTTQTTTPTTQTTLRSSASSSSSSSSATILTTTSASNSTTTSSSSKSSSTKASGTSSTTSASTSTNTPTNTNDSKKLGSPLAFILVTAATLLIFN